MKKRALIVGVDKYKNPTNNLPSCVADAKYFSQVLIEEFSFPDSSVRMLLDENATLANVTREIRDLMSGLSHSDRCVLYFSGHGFQVPMDGDLEEVLVLSDEGMLYDDELCKASKRLPAGTLTVILDACHSGGNQKQFRSSEMGMVKSWTPTFDLTSLEGYNTQLQKTAKFKRFGCRSVSCTASDILELQLGKSFVRDEANDPELNGILLSACKENETATASTKRTNGLSAFTYAISEEISRSGVGLGNETLVSSAVKTLRKSGFKQTPLLLVPGNENSLKNKSFILLDAIGDRSTSMCTNSRKTESTLDPESIVEMLQSITVQKGNKMNNGKAIDGDTVRAIAEVIDAISKGEQDAGTADDKFIVPMAVGMLLSKNFQDNAGIADGDDKFLTPALVTAAAGLIAAVRKDYQPTNGADKGSEKFITPALITATAGLIAAVKKEFSGATVQKEFLPNGSGSADGQDKIVPWITAAAAVIAATKQFETQAANQKSIHWPYPVPPHSPWPYPLGQVGHLS